MSDALLPDVEALVIEVLASTPSITELVDDRISTELDPDAAFPALRVTRSPGSPPIRNHLAFPRVTIEAWGADVGDRPAVRELAAIAQAELLAALPGQHPNVVVGRVATIVDLFPFPDPETGRPRFVFEIEMSLRASRDAS